MKTEFEKCLAGEPFDGSAPEVAAMVISNKRLLHLLRETDYADNDAKQQIYKQMFGSVGSDVYIDIDFAVNMAAIFTSAPRSSST